MLKIARFSSFRLTYSSDHIETHAKFYANHNRTESEINRLANVHTHNYIYIYIYIYIYDAYATTCMYIMCVR